MTDLPKRAVRGVVRRGRARYEREITSRYARLYFQRAERTWFSMKWRGAPVLKTPADMWVYQEILMEVKPDLVVETGSFRGGSALYFADLLGLIGNGSVVTVDVEHCKRPKHPRITYLTGSSVAPEIVEQITAMAEGKRTLVILDSDHSRDHVLAELRAYASLVSPGSYLIVEDTCVRDERLYPGHGPGPADALDIFLVDEDRFEVDRSRERFMHTFNPGGFLRRR